jgi:hypothetical protein
MEYRDYKVAIKGVVPLLHHKFTASTERVGRQIYEPKEEAKKGLYLNKEGVPIQPAVHIEGATIKAAQDFKLKGRKTYSNFCKASLMILEREIPFDNEEADKWVVDEQPVVIQRARVLCWRPRWDKWSFHFTLRNLQPTMLDDLTLRKILEKAGTFIGIGDFRPKFGRFEVAEFEPISKA